MIKDIFDIPSHTYRDLDLDFILHPVTEDLSLLYNDNSIKRSVRNLIKTNYNERPFRPRLGSNITALLFENVDPITISVMKDEISNLLSNYEPRIAVSNISISSINSELKAKIEYIILERPGEIQVLETFLERIR